MKRSFKSSSSSGGRGGGSNKKFDSFDSRSDTPVVSGAVAAAVLLKHNVDKTVALICTLVLLKYHP